MLPLARVYMAFPALQPGQSVVIRTPIILVRHHLSVRDDQQSLQGCAS